MKEQKKVEKLLPDPEPSISHDPAELMLPGFTRQFDVAGTSVSDRLTHEPRNPESENSRLLGIDISITRRRLNN